MGHSVYIYPDENVLDVAGDDHTASHAPGVEEHPVVRAVQEDNGCPALPDAPEDSHDEVSPAPAEDRMRRGRQRRIFLLLALALVAAHVAEAALPDAMDPLATRGSWETYVHGVVHRERDGVPVGLGERPAGSWSPAAPLGHRVEHLAAGDTRPPTSRSLCAVDIGVTVSPPALSLRTRLIGVPLPEVRVPLGALAGLAFRAPAR